MELKKKLETHYKDSKDKFKQAFSHTINTSYTSSIDEFIEYEFYNYKDKSIFHVACKPSTKPIFANVKNKEIFYYRQNPQTIQLEGEKLVEYFSKRFPVN